MLETIIPLALVIAASPVPILPSVLLLMSPGGMANARAYLMAWLAALTAVVVIAVLVGEATYAAESQGTGWGKLIAGVALLALAGYKLIKGRPADPPAWMAELADYTPSRSARLGALLAAANPKNLLMVAAASTEIALVSAGPGRSAATVAIFVMVASIGAAVPVIAVAVLGERADPGLRRGKIWLEQYGHALSVTVLLILGAVLVFQAFAGYTAITVG